MSARYLIKLNPSIRISGNISLCENVSQETPEISVVFRIVIQEFSVKSLSISRINSYLLAL